MEPVPAATRSRRAADVGRTCRAPLLPEREHDRCAALVLDSVVSPRSTTVIYVRPGPCHPHNLPKRADLETGPQSVSEQEAALSTTHYESRGLTARSQPVISEEHVKPATMV